MQIWFIADVKMESVITKNLKGDKMIHHYMTKYVENGQLCVESWLQIWSLCFSRKIYAFNIMNESGNIVSIKGISSDVERTKKGA